MEGERGRVPVMPCIYAQIHITVTAVAAGDGGAGDWKLAAGDEAGNWKVVIMSAWGNTFESPGEK